MTQGFEAERTVLRLSGKDVASFLQNLLTNDVEKPGLVYTALLTPQGKYLADFFLFQNEAAWFLDVASSQVQYLAQRLNMYKLRADVAIEASDLRVFQLWDTELGFEDPREPALGRRCYATEAPVMEAGPDWETLRVAHVIPETGQELVPEDSYILECGFERLNGVDFKKGCYVGQEVTARMKHKTELRKGLARVSIDGVAEPGMEIRTGDKAIGRLHTIAGDRAIAYLRFDQAKGDMRAGDASVALV